MCAHASPKGGREQAVCSPPPRGEGLGVPVTERGAKPILRIRDLHVDYGESHAIQGVSLSLASGILAIVGRNGIANIFLTEVTESGDGKLVNKVIKVIPNVNQTLGEPEEEFVKMGSPGRDNPDCK